jgi:hypothetical protein
MPFDEFDWIRTFREASNLEMLSLPHRALVYYHYSDNTLQHDDLSGVFPYSSQKLSFSWSNNQIVPWMQDIATAKREANFSIHRVKLVCRNNFGVTTH